jgi:hypothetical protein
MPLGVFVFGALATYDGWFHNSAQVVLPLPRAWLLFLGPTLLAVGCVIFFRRFAGGARVLSRRAVLILGSLMLVCPWFYVFSLPGNTEGLAVMWLMAALFVSFPGLVLMLVALAMKSNKQRSNPS